MDVAQLLNELGAAVADARDKGEVAAGLRADLAAYVAEKQAGIDAAVMAYEDAKVAAERLQSSVREVIGELLPAGDPRVRQSK